ncbi:MAG: outer membrane protein assembly factor BamC [Burkholderiaceae bacterium]|nr:outer membrane protein assembly factor BamC [Burkholderiaceae bacterium]
MKDRFTRLRVLAVVGASCLSGCTWTGDLFGSNKAVYESAQTRSTSLEVPPDLSQLPRDDRFVVPDRPQTITASGQGAAQSGRPTAGAATPAAAATSTVVPGGVVAKIERDGNQRWLAVNLPPERVWPVLVEFWPSVGLQVEKSDASVGVLETAWAENKAKLPQDIIRRTLGKALDSIYSTGEQDKYRARLERTAQGTSEVYISHRGMVEVFTTSAMDQTKWQPRPSDPELEAEMLQKLLLRFDAAAARPTATAAAPATPAAAGAAAATAAATTAPAATPQNARVVRGSDGRGERLEIDEGFDRAWRRVGLALDRGAFTVEDRDRTKGIYFVRYLDPEYEAKAKSEQGFFSKMFSSEKPIQAPQFRVVLASGQGGNQTVVTVQNAEGKAERSPTGDRILTLLSDQLR